MSSRALVESYEHDVGIGSHTLPCPVHEGVGAGGNGRHMRAVGVDGGVGLCAEDGVSGQHLHTVAKGGGRSAAFVAGRALFPYPDNAQRTVRRASEGRMRVVETGVDDANYDIFSCKGLGKIFTVVYTLHAGFAPCLVEHGLGAGCQMDMGGTCAGRHCRQFRRRGMAGGQCTVWECDVSRQLFLGRFSLSGPGGRTLSP